jgi:hypothetical protein
VAVNPLAVSRTTVVLVIGLTLLAGCSERPEGSPGPEGEPSDQLPGDSQPDWEALYLREVEELAQAFEQENGVPPPDDTEFVRFVEPTEYGEVHAACARDQGFGARGTFDGGTEYDVVPEDQGLALHEAIYRCQVAYPVHPQYHVPKTEVQIRVIFDYYVNELVPCLVAEGYQVPEAPSWETFLASYETSGQWFPYDVVGYSTEEDWQHVNRTCPQGPPLEDLFENPD